MGKLGRIACIATPMAMTIISIILLFVAFMGGLNKNDTNLSSLYYFRANTTGFKHNITASGILSKNIPGDLDDKLRNFLNKLQSTNSNNKLDDIYEIYLWNYCSGNIDNSTAGTNSSNAGVKLTTCSPMKSQFWFDPVTVWNLNGTGIENLLPTELQKGLNLYQKVSKWMFVAYVLAFWVTLADIVVGLFAICSRWGSCVTAIVSSAATLFTFLAALTSTVLFSTLTGTFNTALKLYGIHLTLGTKMLSLDWIAFVFSLGATLFWTISMCCCSGHSSSPRNRKGTEKGFAAPFASRGYQPLAGQHGAHGGNHVEMGNMGQSPYKGRETAYEPFRHERS